MADVRRLHLPEEPHRRKRKRQRQKRSIPRRGRRQRLPQHTGKHSFSLWNTYAFTPQLAAGVGAYFVGKQYGNTANTITIPSYWRFDAMAGYKFSKTVDLQINVNNLFNKTYYDKAYASHYASIAPGRSAVATLNLHF